jgi:hypothetical protein
MYYYDIFVVHVLLYFCPVEQALEGYLRHEGGLLAIIFILELRRETDHISTSNAIVRLHQWGFPVSFTTRGFPSHRLLCSELS